MMDALFVINVGSSSVKYGIYDPHGRDADGLKRIDRGNIDLQREHVPTIDAAIDLLLSRLNGMRVIAVGHRIVHGGMLYHAPIEVDDDVIAHLHSFESLAPLHQPYNVAALESMRAHLPDALQVACFDTAFHGDQPEVATWFGLNRELYEAGVRRYGFHGLSYEFVAARLPEVLGPIAHGRVIAAHLGSGASMCAMVDGKSVATSMGFTALDGLMMGTRCGDLDPGVVMHLMFERGMNKREINSLLYQGSGLKGVSGISADMRVLLESEDTRAAFAVDLFCYRAALMLGQMAMAAGGVDAIVFTGGIGENSPDIRRRIIERCAWMGIAIDAAANDAALRTETRVEAKGSVAVAVIPTDEERMIARETMAVFNGREIGA
jgi:acetate kinase